MIMLLLLMLQLQLSLLLLLLLRGFDSQHARRSDAMYVLPMPLQIIAVIKIFKADVAAE